jgi:hypothetical protein
LDRQCQGYKGQQGASEHLWISCGERSR